MTNFDLVLMIPTFPLLGILLAAALRTTRLAPGATEQACAQLSDPGLAEVAATARDEAEGATAPFERRAA